MWLKIDCKLTNFGQFKATGGGESTKNEPKTKSKKLDRYQSEMVKKKKSTTWDLNCMETATTTAQNNANNPSKKTLKLELLS